MDQVCISTVVLVFISANDEYYPKRRDGRYDSISPSVASLLWSEPFHLWQRSPEVNLTMMRCISLLTGFSQFWSLYENDNAVKSLPPQNELKSVYDKPKGVEVITSSFFDAYHVADQFLSLITFTHHFARELLNNLKRKDYMYTYSDLEFTIKWLPPSVLRCFLLFVSKDFVPSWEQIVQGTFRPFGRAHWCKLPLYWTFMTADHRTYIGHLNENIDNEALFENILNGNTVLEEVANYFKLCCFGHGYMRASTPVHQVDVSDPVIQELYNVLSMGKSGMSEEDEAELFAVAKQAVENHSISNFPGWTDTSEPRKSEFEVNCSD
jgi:hypothetical protein